MNLKTTFLIAGLFLLNWNLYSQESEESEEKYKPNGKGIIRIYTNYHSTFSDGEASSAFEIQRAYLGYHANFSEKISGRLILDVGDPDFGNFEMTAYLKNAYVQYANGKFLAKIGMIGLHQFKMQEDLWGGRYLYKSFMDEHKFGPSADLGAYVSYRFYDMLSADITIANGEGYKSLESDTTLKYSVGLTLQPLQGLNFRTSYDYMSRDAAQQTLALYLGYSEEKMSLGAEYNYQWNHRMVEARHLQGISVYGSYHSKIARLFARYDNLSSPALAGDEDPWNYADDGHLFIAGMEFNPLKGLRVTPNYQGWYPADGSPVFHSAYLSLEIRF
jgi:hypothetical protein